MPELGKLRGARRKPCSDVVGDRASVVRRVLGLIEQAAQAVLLTGGALEHTGIDVDRSASDQGEGERIARSGIDRGAVGEQCLRVEGRVGQSVMWTSRSWPPAAVRRAAANW